MTPIERRKNMRTFYFITWMKKQIDWKITELSCSEPSDVNRGARACCEHFKRVLEKKRRDILLTNEIGR